MGRSMTAPPCSITDSSYDQTEENTYLLFSDDFTWNIHKQFEMEKMCRAKGCVCVCVWRFHSLLSTAPSQSYSPPKKTLWVQIFMHCWGFMKQAYWLKHLCLVIDLNLSALPSSPRGRNYKPLFSLSVEYSILSVWYSSNVWISNCIPEIITWPMKESKFQEFQGACFMKQEKDQT